MNKWSGKAFPPTWPSTSAFCQWYMLMMPYATLKMADTSEKVVEHLMIDWWGVGQRDTWTPSMLYYLNIILFFFFYGILWADMIIESGAGLIWGGGEGYVGLTERLQKGPLSQAPELILTEVFHALRRSGVILLMYTSPLITVLRLRSRFRWARFIFIPELNKAFGGNW